MKREAEEQSYVVRTCLAFASFEDGGRQSVAKECGKPLEAGKNKE